MICRFSEVKVPSSIKDTPALPNPTGTGNEGDISEMEKASANELNNFINSALRGDFDFTSNVNKNMADGAAEAKKQLQKVADQIDNEIGNTKGSGNIDNTEAPSQNITFYYIPDALPLDIRVKLALILIHFKEVEMVEVNVYEVFIEENKILIILPIFFRYFVTLQKLNIRADYMKLNLSKVDR